MKQYQSPASRSALKKLQENAGIKMKDKGEYLYDILREVEASVSAAEQNMADGDYGAPDESPEEMIKHIGEEVRMAFKWIKEKY